MKKYFYLILLFSTFIVYSCGESLPPGPILYYERYMALFDWSPDGKQIVFLYKNSKGKHIYTIDIDGSNLKMQLAEADRITKNNIDEFYWSSDDEYFILIISPDDLLKIKLSGDGVSERIYNKAQEFLTNIKKEKLEKEEILKKINFKGDSQQLNKPQWLNNKEFLYYQIENLTYKDKGRDFQSIMQSLTDDELHYPIYEFKIYKYTINTVEIEKKELISTVKIQAVTQLVFSPDGNQIAYVSQKKDVESPYTVESIYIMNIDGSNKVKLVDFNMLPKGDPQYMGPKP